MNAAQRLILLAPDRLTLVSAQATNLSDAYWTKSRLTIAENYADPSGGTTAESALETAIDNSHNLGLASALTINPGVFELQTVVISVGGRWADVVVWDEAFAVSASSVFDPTAGVLGAQSDAASMRIISRSIKAAGNGYWLHRMRFYTSFGSVFFYLAARSDASTTSYLGDITKGLGVARFGLYAVQ